jgi:hypothetical protein
MQPTVSRVVNMYNLQQLWLHIFLFNKFAFADALLLKKVASFHFATLSLYRLKYICMKEGLRINSIALFALAKCDG